MKKNSARAIEKQKTIEKILSTSLTLFNQKGVSGTSVHVIAAKMNISPGNLTYHFKKKNDIVNVLTARLEKNILDILTDIKSIDAVMEQHAIILIRLLNVFWKHRFFFNNLIFIADNDINQKKTYGRLKDSVIAVMLDGHKELLANGSMKALDPDINSQVFLENLWYLFLSHLRLYLIETPKSSISQKQYSIFAAKHIYAYLSPYYQEPLKIGYKELLKRELT